MINFKEIMPLGVDNVFVAKTKYGLRKIMFSSKFGGFRYVDCTHPMQNAHCNPFDIYEWEYEDKSKMDELLFQKSWVGKIERQEQADEILKSIKKDNWYELPIMKRLYNRWKNIR